MGEPLNSRDADLLMAQLLGRRFPFVSFGCEPGEKCVVAVTRALDAAETRQLEESYSRFSIDLPLHVEILESPAPSKPFRFTRGQGDIHLLTARYLPPEAPHVLRQRMEQDEDFWSSARRLIWSPDSDQIEAVPESFTSDGGGCLVDTAIWTAGNIRSYLALHRPATFVLPLASNTARLLESLRATERDLLELARIGRVRFVAPQAVDRYDPGFLAALCEAAPDAVLLSRRLAVATAVECKRRLPLLYPSAGTLERHAMLAMISELANLQRDKMQRDIFEALGSTLKHSWSQTEYRLQFEGAMSTSAVGFASFVAELIKRWHGRDLLIEAHAASMTVEWAVALNMSLFPVESPGYSAVPISELLAAAYLGTRQAPAAASLGASERILSGILAPLNDASVLDVCEAFDGRAMTRLRNIVHRVADQSLTTEILDDEVRKFNKEVRRYERRKSRLGWIDFAAPAGILAAQFQLGASAWVPWALFIVSRVLTMQDARPSGWLGHLADRIESARTVSTRDAVFVSRLRRDLS